MERTCRGCLIEEKKKKLDSMGDESSLIRGRELQGNGEDVKGGRITSWGALDGKLRQQGATIHNMESTREREKGNRTENQRKNGER